ncbi:MAG: AbrB/MazE/SpoVT family DNA-binding domain-containing protein [bacterium]
MIDTPEEVCHTYGMKTLTDSDSVRFTTKGQVVIPVGVRRLFHIQAGTRAILSVTEDGIMLRPVTAALIRRGRGIVGRKPGEKSLKTWWAKHRQTERALEEARDARIRS